MTSTRCPRGSSGGPGSCCTPISSSPAETTCARAPCPTLRSADEPGRLFYSSTTAPRAAAPRAFLQYARPCVPPVGPQPVHLGSLEAQRCALLQPVARGSRQPATTKFVVGSTQAQQTELPHAGPWGAGQARYASDRRFCAAWRARLHGDVRLSSVCPPRCLRPPCCWHQSKLKPDLKIWGSAKF